MIRKWLAWLDNWLLDITDTTFQDMVEMNGSDGVNDIDLQILRESELVRKWRWEAFHAKYG